MLEQLLLRTGRCGQDSLVHNWKTTTKCFTFFFLTLLYELTVRQKLITEISR